MTTPLDVDLLDPAWVPPLVFGPVRVLVWAGDEVLGEVRAPGIDLLDGPALRRRLTEQFAERLAHRHLVTQAPGTTPGPERLSVVVCTRDRPAMLARALEHLLALDPAPHEVLVVDNASTSGETARVAAGLGVRCISEPAPGLDRARNTGWQAATGDLVAYVDDDARAHPRLAAALAGAFLGPGVGAVTGLVVAAELATPAQRRFEDAGGMRKGYERRVHHRSTNPVGMRPHLLGVGTNMAFRRQVLADLGGFDPRLDVGTATRGGGDLDMLFRVVEAGHAVVYEPSAVVRHIHRRDWRGLRAQQRDNGVAYAAFLAKYAADADPAMAARARRARSSWHLRWHAAGLLGALRRGQLRRATHLLAEAWASRRGVAALALETANAARAERAASAATD